MPPPLHNFFLSSLSALDLICNSLTFQSSPLMSCTYSESGFPLNLTLQTGDKVAELNEKGECVFPSKMVILKDVYY